MTTPYSNRKIRALLVANPKTDLGFDRAARVPNLGLYSIAANVDRTICDIVVLDLVVAGKNYNKVLRKVIEEFQPDVVGIGCMSFQYCEALSLARIVKSTNSAIKVVLGGYHPTVAYKDILVNSDTADCIDFLIRNEGEIAFNTFITALQSGSDLRTVPNLSFRDNGSPVHNPSGEPLDLETIKPPDRSVRYLKKGFYLFGNPADVIETSRGCTFNCDFCSISNMYGKKYRRYSIARIMDDIRDAKKRGAKALFVADDNIALDGGRFLELCNALITEKLDMQFFIQASIKGLHHTPGLIDTMVKAGVRWTFLGIENILPATLAFLDKHDQFKNDDVFDVVTALRRKKVITIGGLIIGSPDDTRESIMANYEYARQLKLDVALFFILTPFPQTAIRDKLMELGLITNPDDFTRYTCFLANVKTKHLSSEELFELREDLGFRYPLNSGSLFSLAREFFKHPFHYTFIMGLGQLINNPSEIAGYLKGLKRRKQSKQ